MTNLFQKIRENTWDLLDFEAARASILPSAVAAAMFGVVAFGVYTFGDGGVGRPEQPTTAEITGALRSALYHAKLLPRQ